MACIIDLQLRHNKLLSCFHLLQLCNPQWHDGTGISLKEPVHKVRYAILDQF